MHKHSLFSFSLSCKLLHIWFNSLDYLYTLLSEPQTGSSEDKSSGQVLIAPHFSGLVRLVQEPQWAIWIPFLYAKQYEKNITTSELHILSRSHPILILLCQLCVYTSCCHIIILCLSKVNKSFQVFFSKSLFEQRKNLNYNSNRVLSSHSTWKEIMII